LLIAWAIKIFKQYLFIRFIMEEVKLDKNTELLNNFLQLGRWKKFTEKLESMTPEQRAISFRFVDPDT